jgi:toxin-antitoxin system PIN domain toxin
VNLLLFATNPEAPQHDRARAWFDDQMNSGQRVGIPWKCLVSFVRLSTGSARRPPFTMGEALDFVQEWLEWDMVWTPEATDRHAEVFVGLLTAVPRNRLVEDAHIAALAIEHGLTLCSADADFKLFPGLRFHNPLE